MTHMGQNSGKLSMQITPSSLVELFATLHSLFDSKTQKLLYTEIHTVLVDPEIAIAAAEGLKTGRLSS